MTSQVLQVVKKQKPSATVSTQIEALRRDPRTIADAEQQGDAQDRAPFTSTCQMLTADDFIREPVLLERMQQALTGVGLDCAIMHYRSDFHSLLVFNRCFGIKTHSEKMGYLDVFSAFVPAPTDDDEFDASFPLGTLDYLDNYSPPRTVDEKHKSSMGDGTSAAVSDDLKIPEIFKERAVALYDTRTYELMRAGGPTFLWRALAFAGDEHMPSGIVCLEGWKMAIVKIGGKTKKAINKKKHRNKLVDEPDMNKVRTAVADVVQQARRLAAQQPQAMTFPELDSLLGATDAAASATANNNDDEQEQQEPFIDDGAGRRALLALAERYGPDQQSSSSTVVPMEDNDDNNAV